MVYSVMVGIMGGSVEEPWNDCVDIKSAGEAYFAPRETSLSLYDPDGSIKTLADAAKNVYNMEERNYLIDRAVRMYLACILDKNDRLAYLRSEYEVTAAIPPSGWISTYKRDQVKPENFGCHEAGTIGAKTVRPVKEMIVEVVEHGSTDFESQSEFAIEALQWFTKNVS